MQINGVGSIEAILLIGNAISVDFPGKELSTERLFGILLVLIRSAWFLMGGISSEGMQED